MKRAVRSPIRVLTLALLIFTLIGTLSACASDENEYMKPSNAIPEGWEIVSESEGVTYLQMKEGSDAYKWEGVSLFDNGKAEFDCFEIFLEIPENPNLEPLDISESDHINVIVYYGFFYAEKDFESGFFKISEATADLRERSFEVSLVDADGIFPPIELGELTDFNTDYTVNPKKAYIFRDYAEVGFTQAVMLSIPISSLETDWNTYELTVGSQDGQISRMEYIACCQVFDKLFFDYDHENRIDAIRETFPYVIYEAHDLINGFLILASIAIMILCAVKRWNCLLHMIPCVIGILYSKIAQTYFAGLPHIDDMFGGLDYAGQEIALYLAIVGFEVLAIVLLVIRLALDFIRRRKAKQAASVPVPPAAPAE